MNSFVCLVLLAAVASAQLSVKAYNVPVAAPYGSYASYAPYGAYPYAAAKYYSAPVDVLKSGVGSTWSSAFSHVNTPYKFAEVPSVYSFQVPQTVEVKPKSWTIQSAPVVSARSESSDWKVEPSWTGASVVPSWSSVGYYSAAPVEQKQVVAKKVAAPVAKVEQPQQTVEPKPFSYATEIAHEVPAKKENVQYGSVQAAPVAAPVAPKVVSAPLQYSAWSEEVKPVSWNTEVKPASWNTEVRAASWAPEAKVSSWTSEVKPTAWANEAKINSWTSEAKPASYAPAPEVKVASWTSEIKPATWTSEIKPATWTSEIKPATVSWAEPKPLSWQFTPEVKPASWASWSEAKPWGSYVSPVQPAFYSASSWASPIATNAHQALSAPWSSLWSTSTPVASIQKRSERKAF